MPHQYQLEIISPLTADVGSRFTPIMNLVNHDGDYHRLTSTLPIKKVQVDDSGCVHLLTETGQLYYVGSNDRGQSGLGHKDPITQLQLTREGVKDVFAAYSTCFTLMEDDDKLFMQGQNTYGTHPHTSDSCLDPTEFSASTLFPHDPTERFVMASPCFSSSVLWTNRRKLYVSGQYYWYNGQVSGPSFGSVAIEGLESHEEFVLMSSGNFHCYILTNEGNVYVGGQGAQNLLVGHSSPLVGFRRLDVVEGKFRHVSCFKYISMFLSMSNDVYFLLDHSSFLTKHFKSETLPNAPNLRKLVFESPMPTITECFLSYNQFMFLTVEGVIHAENNSGDQNQNYKWIRQVKANPNMRSSSNTMNIFYCKGGALPGEGFRMKLRARASDGLCSDVDFVF